MLLIKLKKTKFKNLIILVFKNKRNYKYNRVLEVLGSYNSQNNHLSINIFRIIYWFSKNIFCTGEVLTLLLLFNLIKLK